VRFTVINNPPDLVIVAPYAVDHYVPINKLLRDLKKKKKAERGVFQVVSPDVIDPM
jgi:hypothetical protein